MVEHCQGLREDVGEGSMIEVIILSIFLICGFLFSKSLFSMKEIWKNVYIGSCISLGLIVLFLSVSLAIRLTFLFYLLSFVYIGSSLFLFYTKGKIGKITKRDIFFILILITLISLNFGLEVYGDYPHGWDKAKHISMSNYVYSKSHVQISDYVDGDQNPTYLQGLAVLLAGLTKLTTLSFTGDSLLIISNFYLLLIPYFVFLIILGVNFLLEYLKEERDCAPLLSTLAILPLAIIILAYSAVPMTFSLSLMALAIFGLLEKLNFRNILISALMIFTIISTHAITFYIFVLYLISALLYILFFGKKESRFNIKEKGLKIVICFAVSIALFSILFAPILIGDIKMALLKIEEVNTRTAHPGGSPTLFDLKSYSSIWKNLNPFYFLFVVLSLFSGSTFLFGLVSFLGYSFKYNIVPYREPYFFIFPLFFTFCFYIKLLFSKLNKYHYLGFISIAVIISLFAVISQFESSKSSLPYQYRAMTYDEINSFGHLPVSLDNKRVVFF